MEDFIVRLKLKDEEALTYMIDTYMPFIKGICQHILLKSCGPHTAEECLNDVFLLIWQKAYQFEGDAVDFRKWVGIITKYKAIDSYRRHTKHQQRESSASDIQNEGWNHGTEDTVVQNESRDEILYRMNKLPEADRELFMMKYYLDLSNSEIANTLGITISAVENRLYRGKRKLAHLLERKERFI